MAFAQDIVITGLGLATPIGIGRDAVWESLVAGRGGVDVLTDFVEAPEPRYFAGQVRDFRAATYVRPRKALKVMSRDIQLGVAAAELACQDARIDQNRPDPERIGVVCGADMIAPDLLELSSAYRKCLEDGPFEFDRWGKQAMAEIFPLWMLKYLPNMPACHIAIAQEAHGPNNTHVEGDVSSLSAVAEGARIVDRGQADVMICGGSSARIRPCQWLRDRDMPQSRRFDTPSTACRPFDVTRDGVVHGEGAAAIVLETRAHATASGRVPLARLLGHAVVFGNNASPGDAIRRAIRRALAESRLEPSQIGMVSAHGLGAPREDVLEAEAIDDCLSKVPVTALKSYYGNLEAASGAVETALSVLALQHGQIPPTLNHEQPDPACPINVVHGEPLPLPRPTALVLSYSPNGPAAALVLESVVP